MVRSEIIEVTHKKVCWWDSAVMVKNLGNFLVGCMRLEVLERTQFLHALFTGRKNLVIQYQFPFGTYF